MKIITLIFLGSRFLVLNKTCLQFDDLSTQSLDHLMFAINSQESFQKLETYWNDVLRTKDVDQLPMIFIGTKVDLESDRTVSEQEINKFCSERGLQYMESSAKTRMNIEESYYDLVRQHRASAHSTKPDNTRTSNKCSLQ